MTKKSFKDLAQIFLIICILIIIIYLILQKYEPMVNSIDSSNNLVGVTFTPSGLLIPFHLGVATELINLGIIKDTTILAGNSGGAITAVLCALDIKLEEGLNAAKRIAERCNKEGNRLTLRKASDVEMEKILPDESHLKLYNRKSKCIIGYREVYPRRKSHFINEFNSKEDLIEVTRGSCCIPYYFNGNTLGVKVRGVTAIDGHFSMPISRFGSPYTGAKREIIVCPLHPNLIGLNPYIDTPLANAKDVYKPWESSLESEMPELHKSMKHIAETVDNIINENQENVMSSEQNIEMSITTDAKEMQDTTTNVDDTDIAITKKPNIVITEQYEIISPALLPKEQWPFTIVQLLQLMLGPPPSSLNMSITEIYDKIFKCGQDSAKIWAKNVKNLDDFIIKSPIVTSTPNMTKTMNGITTQHP